MEWGRPQCLKIPILETTGIMGSMTLEITHEGEVSQVLQRGSSAGQNLNEITQIFLDNVHLKTTNEINHQPMKSTKT